MNNEKEKLTLLEEIPEKASEEYVDKSKAYVDDVLDTCLKELEKEIKKTQTSVIEALALFAAFFTFVAVNVQIFTGVTHLKSAMWFTVLLMGALGFFALIVHIIIREEDKYFNFEYGKFKIYISRKIIFLIIFLSFVYFALYAVDNENLNIEKENKENIKIENQGSFVEIKDNNIPIETQ